MKPTDPSLMTPGLLREALTQAFVKLNPVLMLRNPVMFCVEAGTAVMLALSIWLSFHPDPAQGSAAFNWLITSILFVTVLFANGAEALAEARGKAQAASLRKTREETPARRRLPDGREEMVSSSQLRTGEVFLVQAGEIIPADGEIIEGMASIDESAITGESAPVIREAGTDRSGVTGGTRVLSDRIVVRVTLGPGESFLDKMIALVEGASRQKTPNELALTQLLAAFTIIFLIATVSLYFFGAFAGIRLPLAALVSLFVCLIPTTIGGLLSAIGIAGMDRALRARVIAKSGRAVETAGDIDVVMLDKTGTITIGNRKATRFMPLAGVDAAVLHEQFALASAADTTPEGKSIVELAQQLGYTLPEGARQHGTFVPFTAETRMSGVDLPGGLSLRKGSADSVRRMVERAGGTFPEEAQTLVDQIARQGGTPLLLAAGPVVQGAAQLEDVLKPGIQDRFTRLRKMGVQTVMITGDNPLTAAYIAREAGVDDFIAEARPEDKLAYIQAGQQAGRLVAMMGDGANDAPALAQADVGVAMNSGTQAAKEAGNMVDLDNDPAKLIEIVEIGKQLLITRGALTTFSIANDVAKYFAILPALFIAVIPGFQALNIMQLGSPESAVLSAVIFNALIIPALIPLALRGVRYRPAGASSLLARNLLIYGLGGLISPFIGIKLIDLILQLF